MLERARIESVLAELDRQERPVDAVVAIGISGNLVSKAKKVLARGVAREALNVQVRSPE